jgi:hypothetical protein
VRRAWRSGRLAAFAILLVLLPNVLYLGHLGPGAPSHTHAAAQQQEHERHCHGESASCSDAPVQASVPFAESVQAVLTAPDERGFDLPALTVPAGQHSARPLLPPPNPSAL